MISFSIFMASSTSSTLAPLLRPGPALPAPAAPGRAWGLRSAPRRRVPVRQARRARWPGRRGSRGRHSGRGRAGGRGACCQLLDLHLIFPAVYLGVISFHVVSHLFLFVFSAGAGGRQTLRRGPGATQCSGAGAGAMFTIRKSLSPRIIAMALQSTATASPSSSSSRPSGGPPGAARPRRACPPQAASTGGCTPSAPAAPQR